MHQIYLSRLPIPQPISSSSTRPLSHFYDGGLKRGLPLTEHQHSDVTQNKDRRPTTRWDQINQSTLSAFIYTFFVVSTCLWNRHCMIKRKKTNSQRGLPEFESKFLVGLKVCLLRRCPSARESVERKACFLAYSSCKNGNKSFSKLNKMEPSWCLPSPSSHTHQHCLSSSLKLSGQLSGTGRCRLLLPTPQMMAEESTSL